MNAIVVYKEIPQSLTVVYQEPGGVDAVLALIEKQAREEAAGLDVSRPKDREKMASLARTMVARSKTALLDAGSKLTEGWKTAAAKVDAEKRTITKRLDALRDEIRQPLTDWENAEKARITAHEDLIARLGATQFDGDCQIADIDERLAWIATIDGRDWQEFKVRGTLAITNAVAAVTKMRADLVKREEDARELARLKAEEDERELARQEQERAAREARIAQEAADHAKREAEDRAAAEAARIAREAQEREAALERQKRDAEEALATAERRANQAAEQAERDREAAVGAERKRQADEAARLKREEDVRAANKAHQKKINGEALTPILAALIEYNVEAMVADAMAKKIVTMIARGEVPHVRITY